MCALETRAAAAAARDARRDDAGSGDDGSDAGADAGLSSAAARVLGGIHAPATAALAAARFNTLKSASSNPRKKRDPRAAASTASTASAARARRALAVDLLVEMDPAEFKQPSAQSYFAGELASELGARADRFRVTAYDEVSGAATVSVDDAPGDVALDDLVTSLRAKIDADALLIDPAFGSVVLAQIIWPEGWRDGAPPPPSLVTNDARGETREGSVAASDAGSGEDVSSLDVSSLDVAGARAETAANPPSRLVLVSSRVRFADALLSAARDGVVAVYFDWRFGSLQALAHDCAAACRSSAPGFRGLKSVGLVTHHKPGAVGLVKGLRLTRRNLARGELRQFWLAIAALLRPGGRVDMLAYDASACAPTRRLLEELEDLTRAPARAVDAAAAAAAGVVDPEDFEDADDFEDAAPGPVNPASTYFRPRRFHAWALAAPEKFTLGAEKYLAPGADASGVPDPDRASAPERDRYRNAAGLPGATSAAAAFELDPEVDEATAARVSEARAAKARDAAEAARRRAMARNPADVLRETTQAGGAAYDPMTLKPYETLNPTNPQPGVTRAALERFALDVAPDVAEARESSADAARARRRSLVPRLPAARLAAARDDAAAYDARLDARAAETRARDERRGLMSDAALDAEERIARHEARVEDLSLVPTLKGPFLERELKGVAASLQKTPRGALAVVSPNLPAADAFGDDADANDAPDPARVVDAHGLGAARPRWDADRHLEKLRRYENTGL